MAPYLATATLGRFDVTQDELASGLPVYIAIDPTLSTTSVLKKLPDIVEFYSSIYGPYPFDAVGAIVDDAKQVGYSLETQTKPVFYRPPDEATLARELSHMWYGDSGDAAAVARHLAARRVCHLVGVDLSEHQGRKSAHHIFKTLYNTPAQDAAFWTPPPAVPGIAGILVQRDDLRLGGHDPAALREKVGDEVFFRSCATGPPSTATGT